MTGKANPRFQEALAFAAQAHADKNQARKGTDALHGATFDAQRSIGSDTHREKADDPRTGNV